MKELGLLTGRAVDADELGNPEQLKELHKAAQKLAVQPTSVNEILFSEKNSERFMEFLQRLKRANPSSIYVITPRTDSCGALLVSSLNDIRFDFDFSVNSEGILVFTTSDFCDSLLLDFSSAPTGEKIMKIETQGQNWAKITP